MLEDFRPNVLKLTRDKRRFWIQLIPIFSPFSFDFVMSSHKAKIGFLKHLKQKKCNPRLTPQPRAITHNRLLIIRPGFKPFTKYQNCQVNCLLLFRGSLVLKTLETTLLFSIYSAPEENFQSSPWRDHMRDTWQFSTFTNSSTAEGSLKLILMSMAFHHCCFIFFTSNLNFFHLTILECQ